AIDIARKHVAFANGYVRYDYLILATGAMHAYFGHDQWASIAPGLKSIEDAIELRRRILLAFESAEYEGNEAARRAALTFAIVVGVEFVPVRNVCWAAGVKASPLGKSLGVATDRAGRVIVGPDLTIPGHPEVFVLGDLAAAISANDGRQVPGVAQGGIQMGRFAGETIVND